jgi:hypothetical protein
MEWCHAKLNHSGTALMESPDRQNDSKSPAGEFLPATIAIERIVRRDDRQDQSFISTRLFLLGCRSR